MDRSRAALPLRVLILSSFPPAIGGGELQTLEQARRIAAAGHTVVIIDLRPRGLSEKTPQWDGLSVHRIRTPNIPLLRTVVYHLVLSFLTVRAARFADVAQFNHIGPAVVTASPLLAMFGVPRLLVIWGSAMNGVGPFASGWRNWIARRSAAKLERFVALASAAVPQLARNGFDRSRIVFIPNGVDTAKFHPAGDTDHHADREHERPSLKVISVGRLVPAKGWDVLLDSWAVVRSSHPEAILEIVGDGPLRDSLRLRIESLGLVGSVKMLGARSDVPELLREADIYVSSSRTEGMSNALLEALSTGLPIVATRVGGAEDIVFDEETGVLVPPGDPGALTMALISLLDSKPKRTALSMASRRSAESTFALAAVSNRYMALYSDMAKGRWKSQPT